MKTAVVILNWNGLLHLQRYLPSVVATTPNADIVVADNGSTDGSLAWLREAMPSVQTIALDKNYGFAEGYNRALRKLSGYDVYVLLNSDIRTEEGWLSPLLNYLEQNDDVAVVVPTISATIGLSMRAQREVLSIFWAIPSVVGAYLTM